jgi:hypothetical protein
MLISLISLMLLVYTSIFMVVFITCGIVYFWMETQFTNKLYAWIASVFVLELVLSLIYYCFGVNQ